MDYYLNTENAYNRLENEYKKHGNIIIAVDFDDTLYDYHKKGRDYSNVISLLQKMKYNAYFIIYTASKKERYPEIEDYCYKMRIPYCTINENIKGINVPQGGKLYYNILLDDRAGLREAYTILKRLADKIERGELECDLMQNLKQKI